MSPLPSDRELARVFAKDGRGLARLLRVGPTGRITTVTTDAGPVACVDGRKLHSGRDPVREARRFVRGLDIGEATVLVVMGFGSGHVVRALRQRSDATIIVYESNLEVLRVGLNHGPLPADCFVSTTASNLGATLYELFQTGDRGQLVLWQPSMRLDLPDYAHAVEQTKLAIERAQMRAVTSQVRVEGWLDHYLRNLPQLTRGPGLAAFKGRFAGTPAIICSAGPSLTKQLPKLADVTDRALVLAVNTAATALGKHGVAPHAVVSVESLDITGQLADLPWLRDVAGFLEMTGNPNIFDLPFRRIAPVSVDTSACSRFTRKLDPDNHVNGGFCVAHTAMSIAHVLGCSPIILIGQDLAFAGDKVYAAGTVFEEIRAEFSNGTSQLTNVSSKKDIEARSGTAFKAGVSASLRANTDLVPGWGGTPEVVTTRDFRLFRDWFSQAGETLRDRGVEVVNATEGGAEILHWREESFVDVVDRLGLDLPLGADEVPVRQRFDACLNTPGVDPGRLLGALLEERARIDELVSLSRRARALVNDDPDGDITAPVGVQVELAQIQRRVMTALSAAPLVAESLTVPLDALRDRQELNTYTLHRTIETQLLRLDERLESVLEAVAELDASQDGSLDAPIASRRTA